MSERPLRYPSPGLFEVVTLGGLLGMVSGGAAWCADVIRRVRFLEAGDVTLVFIIGALVTGVCAAALAFLFAVVFRILRVPLGRGQWLGLLSGVAVIGLLSIYAHFRMPTAAFAKQLVIMLGSMPAAAIVYFALSRWTSLDGPRRGVILTLAALVGFLGLAAAFDVVKAWQWPMAVMAAPGLAALLFLGWAHRQAVTRPRRAITLLLNLAIAVPVLDLAIASRSAARPAALSPQIIKEGSPPNVVVIVLDTTRRDVLGCYGHSGGLTPTLDAIAREGTVYDHFFSQAPWTVPSHATLFTGMYPQTHGCSYERRLWLDDGFDTMAERFSARGYQTVALNSNYHITHANLLQGFDSIVDLKGQYSGLPWRYWNTSIGWPARWADKGASGAPIWLRNWARDIRQPDKPFFLFINLLEVHHPYLPPYAERRAFLPKGVSYRDATNYSMRFNPQQMELARRNDAKGERIIRALYEAQTLYQDRMLAEIMAALDSISSKENTLLIITADHGENINDAGRWGHEYEVNDTLIHVPLVVRYPKLFPAGKRVKGFCEMVDVLPTLYEIAGWPTTGETMPGKSLLPSAFQPKKEIHAYHFPHYLGFSRAVTPPLLTQEDILMRYHDFNKVIRTETHKLIWSAQGLHALYDLRNDPQETHNIFEENRPLGEELERTLLEWWAAQPGYIRHAPTGKKQYTDPRAIERLRELGYVQ